MSKEETKTETKVSISPVTPTLALDPATLAAIQAAVKESVSSIVAQLTPRAAATQTPSLPVVNAGAPPVQPQFSDGTYVPKLKGIPVQPGQDLRHVHPSVITTWFNNVETRWKEQYNKRKVGGAPVDMNWTRG